MKHVIFCDPEKDKEVRKLFRSISPHYSARSLSPKIFRTKIYPKFTSYLKKKEEKIIKEKQKNEEKLAKTTKQINYSEMWSKNVISKETKPFLERAQERVLTMWEKQAINEKMRIMESNQRVNECTFRPQIDQKAKSIGPRGIEDWYEWDKNREDKRALKKIKNDQMEMVECQGKFRSPETRTQKMKEKLK